MNQTLGTWIDRVAWDGHATHRAGLIVRGWWRRPFHLAALVRTPRRLAIDGSSCVRIAPGLEELARLQDPVVDRAAPWLLAVSCLAEGETVRLDRQPHFPWLYPAELQPLTDEGRAWLVRTALSLIEDPATLRAVCAELSERAR
ncbi:MAG: hypothetical protein ACTS22_07185 [Phycisphaerales bacterium]